MKDFVITPDDELVAQSTASKKIAATITKFENWHPQSIEELTTDMLSLPGGALKEFMEFL